MLFVNYLLQISSAALLLASCAAMSSSSASILAGPVRNSTSWVFNADSDIHSSAAITKEGVVVFGSLSGMIYAVNISNGQSIWSKDSNGSYITSSPALDAEESIVILTTVNPAKNSEAIILGLDPKTGDLFFQTNVSQLSPGVTSVYSTPLVLDNSAIIACGDSILSIRIKHTYDANDEVPGTILWEYRVPFAKLLSTGATLNSKVYFSTANNKAIVALNTETGLVCWKQSLNSFVSSSPVVDSEREILYATASDGVHSINISNAIIDNCTNSSNIPIYGFDRKIWDYQASAGISSVALSADGNSIYFAADNNVLYSLDVTDPFTYSSRWTFKTSNNILLSSPVVDKQGHVYIGDIGGVIYAVAGEDTTKNLWPPQGPGLPVMTAETVRAYIDYVD